MRKPIVIVFILSLILASCSSLTRNPSADSTNDFVCKGPHKTRFMSNSGHADYFAIGEKNVSCRE